MLVKTTVPAYQRRMASARSSAFFMVVALLSLCVCEPAFCQSLKWAATTRDHVAKAGETNATVVFGVANRAGHRAAATCGQGVWVFSLTLVSLASFREAFATEKLARRSRFIGNTGAMVGV